MHQRVIQDLRYALRTLRRSPGFTSVAIVTLALGIAANTTVFSFANALFLRELPVKNAARLVRVYGSARNQDDRFFAYPEFAFLRDRVKTLNPLVAHYSTAPLYVTAKGLAGEIQGAVVSASYFPALGVTPYLGRFFTPQEDTVPDRDQVAVIGYHLWRNWFGADPAIAGKALRINSQPFQIIGVAPESFQGIEIGAAPNEIWIPSMMLRTGYRWCDALQDEECTPLAILGSLAPGATVQQVNAEVATLARQHAASKPGLDATQSAWATPAIGERARMAGGRQQLAVVRLLWLAAMGLLAIACVNLAGLLMARGAARAKEIAVRLSLGAGRARILQQLITESLLLAAFGGALGLALSMWTNELLAHIVAIDDEGYPRMFDMSLDRRTLLYAIALALVTGIVFGILPAAQAARQALARRTRTRSALVACQTALALVLLVDAGLLARSVAQIQAASWDPQHVVLLRLRPRLLGYTPDRAQAFQREVLRRLPAAPGVVSAGLTAGDGLVWKQGREVRLAMPGQQAALPEYQKIAFEQRIAPSFFATLGLSLLRGRDFDEHDQPGAPRVAIAGQTLARQLWPNRSDLGKSVMLDGQPYRIVGVAGDAQLRNDLQSPVPMIYVPYWQDATMTDSRMCIRVAGNPASALPGIKAVISGIDAQVPITEAMPMIAQLRGAFSHVVLARSMLLSAGGLALLLTAIGLYGVLAFVVRQRTREIGIRMAIGARPQDVVRLFLKHGIWLAGLGSTAGLLLALASTRLLAAFLYGEPVRDPIAFLCGAALLIAVALLAAWLPSRRAARIDPMESLRYE